jgi:hypothetical protein
VIKSGQFRDWIKPRGLFQKKDTEFQGFYYFEVKNELKTDDKKNRQLTFSDLRGPVDYEP